MLNRNVLYSRLVQSFGFNPTEGQAIVLYHLAAFLLSDKANPTYLLRGYAGTGKTTLVKALANTLPTIGMKYVLLAPTGRAAKVLSNYTGQNASTIHRHIYQTKTFPDSTIHFVRAENKSKNTIFIIDEASMIGEQHEFGGKSLLDDLLEYVFSGERCRLLLIGDTAQLPPIESRESPALDYDYMKSQFPITVATFELTEVKRQALESGILYNATQIRQKIQENAYEYSLPIFNIGNYSDISIIAPDAFEELLYNVFSDNAGNEAVVVCKSNKRANMFNQAIRSKILNIEGEIATGDRLMVVKNNYYWVDGNDVISFIANGDMAEIRKIKRFEELYGFRFADVELSFVDYPDQPNIETKILLDTLNSGSASLTEEESHRLFASIEEDYMDIPNRRERYKEMRNNPWFNALQVKFAYALTCHKTQGGQWSSVFIDSAFNQKDLLETEDMRWIYTALTRAQQHVYFVNYKEEFFLTSPDAS